MRAFVALPFVLLATSCGSSSKDAPPSPDASSDDASGPSPDAAGAGEDAGVLADTCGAAPYVSLGITVTALSASGTAPLPGARFTTPLCPGSYKTTDADGKLVGLISKSVPFYGRFEAPNYIKTLTPESRYDADATDVGVQILPGIFAALIKGFDAASTVICVGGFKDGGHGACDALDGMTYAVVNHPEAVVTYYSNDSVPVATTDTSTTASGRAAITGLAPGEPVTLTGAKAGCEVVFAHGAATGRYPLEAGYLTLAGAYVHDAASDASAD